MGRGTRAEGAPTSRDASTEEPPPPPRGEWSRAGRAAREKRVSQTASARLTTQVARAVVANAKAAGPEGTRALVCESATRGGGARRNQRAEMCLSFDRQASHWQIVRKGSGGTIFMVRYDLLSHGIPVMIRFHFFNTLRLARGSHHLVHLERTCALSTAASPRSSRGADPGSASRRTLEAHTRGRPRLASGRSRARVGHRELGTRASNGLVRAHGARRSTRSAPPFALLLRRSARERRLSPWPSTRTRFGSWRTAA